MKIYGKLGLSNFSINLMGGQYVVTYASATGKSWSTLTRDEDLILVCQRHERKKDLSTLRAICKKPNPLHFDLHKV